MQATHDIELVPDRTTAETEPADTDDLFDALAHSHRRSVVDALATCGPVDRADLAALIAADHESTTADAAERALVHNHLPRLLDAGVVARVDHSRYALVDETPRRLLRAVRASD